MRYILKNVSLSPITIGGVVSVASGADIVVYDDSTFDMHPQIDAILDATENTYVDISYNINYNVVKGYLEYYNDVTPKTIGAFYEWLSEFKRKYQFYKKIQGLGHVTVKLDFNNDRLVVNVVGGTAVDDITIRYNDADQLEVKDGSIGNAKSADMGEGLIKGRAVSAGTGAPQDLTQSQVHTVIGRGIVNGVASLGSDGKVPRSESSDITLSGVVEALLPELTKDSLAGTVTVPPLRIQAFDNPDFMGYPSRYTTVETTLTLTEGVRSLIYFDQETNQILLTTDDSILNLSNRIALYIVSWVAGTIHSIGFDTMGHGLPQKTELSVLRTTPYKRTTAGGLMISEDGALHVQLTGSIVYAGTTPNNIFPYNSVTDILTQCYHVGGVWNYSSASHTYNNTQYDDGTNLVTLGNNKFKCVWFFRSIGDSKEVFYVNGIAEYNSVATAQLGTVPPIPPVVGWHCMLVGRIIIGKNAVSGVVQSAFSQVFTAIPTTEHNSLSGIQGGAVGDYQHLTNAQVTSFTNKPSSVFGRTGAVVATLGDYNTDLVTEGSTNLYFTNSRADARITAQKGVANGIAPLDASTKIPLTYIPASAITETFVVNSQAAMLALTAQRGDVAVRTDNRTSYILQADPASTLSNWVELLSPTDGVTSVALSAPSLFTVTGSPITSAGTLSFAWNGSSANLVRADGSTVAQSTFLTGNQTITLSGEATGSGATSIAVTLANSAVIGKVLTGYTATSGTIAATDTILQAIQKLGFDKHVAVTLGTANGLSLSTQALSLALASTSTTGALSSTNWNTFNGKLNLTSLLTGYVVGANTALAATDSILGAFQKLQGQVNARLTANQTITLSGDVSGSGSISIAATVRGITVTEHSANNTDYPVVWDNTERALFHTAAKLKFNPSSGLLSSTFFSSGLNSTTSASFVGNWASSGYWGFAGSTDSGSSAIRAVLCSNLQGAITSLASLSVDILFTGNNGNGTNIKIGDDAWIGDVNLGNAIGLKGIQDGNKGYIKFGSDDGLFGYNGSRLTYSRAFEVTGMSYATGGCTVPQGVNVYLGSSQITRQADYVGLWGLSAVWQFGRSSTIYSSHHAVSATFNEGIDALGVSYFSSANVTGTLNTSSLEATTAVVNTVLNVPGIAFGATIQLSENNTAVFAVSCDTVLPAPTTIGTMLFLYADSAPSANIYITAPSGYTLIYRSSGTTTVSADTLVFNNRGSIAIAVPRYNASNAWFIIF